jgi:hypothetical protein
MAQKLTRQLLEIDGAVLTSDDEQAVTCLPKQTPL